jgi:hypothetical protein
MSTSPEKQELQDRLNLIESMIAEGRQTTESWGWTFVLWGVAYYVAIAWSTWGNSNLAWPVTMITTGAITAVVASRQGSREAETTIGRAISGIWGAVGFSLFALLLAASLAGRAEQHVFVAVIATLLATANAASSYILKWRAQFLCALVWWTAAIASLFGSINQSSIVFLVAIFFCQIVFGAYMMYCESRERKQQKQSPGAAHA